MFKDKNFNSLSIQVSALGLVLVGGDLLRKELQEAKQFNNV